jgi:hypothetical protein
MYNGMMRTASSPQRRRIRLADALGGKHTRWTPMQLGVLILVAIIRLSPRIPLPIPIPGKRFFLRIEDLLSVPLFGWLISISINPQRRVNRTGLFLLVTIYSAVTVVITCIGIIAGTVTLPELCPSFSRGSNTSSFSSWLPTGQRRSAACEAAFRQFWS